MAKLYHVLCLALIIIASTGCSKEDDLSQEETVDDFYKDALVSANQELLSGTWSIYEAFYLDNRAELPPNFQNCGRDFFQFINDGQYKEFITTEDYQCKREILELNWTLEKGILTLTDPIGQSEEMVITKLGTDQLVFKVKLDIDEDGELDVLSFLAKRYSPPNDLDIYSYTFQPQNIDSSDDKIKLEWLVYNGFYSFERYEIYRSKNGCSKANAELIATIEDASINFFIDEDPPVQEELCYYIKIYNEKGPLSESELVNFPTENLIPAKIGFSNVTAFSESVELNWKPYEGNYFSHYKITVRNYVDGTGSGYYEETVAEISDIETSTYADINPPYLQNPVYAIYAYDIFGNVSNSSWTGENTWKLDWKRPEVFDFDAIQFVTVDPYNPEVYLFGKKSTDHGYDLLKYNYQLKEVSAMANKVPELSNSISMQVLETENGKELFFPQGNSLSVYDADNLSLKYKLTAERSTGFDDFTYLGDNIFAFTDRNTLYTYKRDNGTLSFIDQKSHFTEHQSSSNFQIIKLKNNQILVGHYREPQSFLFSIDANGAISNGSLVDIPIKSKYNKRTFYSADMDHVINLEENKLYSTQTFSSYYSFEAPYYPTGISRDGNFIMGSNNDPNDESIHAKQALIHNISTGQLTYFNTKGYPHLLLQDASGRILSVSSGFKRANLESYVPGADLFVEVIE
ncbi:lipocalin family protein [Salinimicrobium catena]|uniref:lipocalin family protein n=1 Tax=Salinimicrobium catena TaxID=390640 RepID=UPI002FE4A902